MKITMVAGHACIRVQKMALALLDKGHEVHLIASQIPPYYEYYNTFSLTAGIGQYIDAIKIYSKITDVFHVHNEPSWFVTAIKEHTKIPVILDVHDTYLTRVTPEEQKEKRDKGEDIKRVYTEERNNFQLADGLNFVSGSVAKQVRTEFGLDQPYNILPPYMPKRLYEYNCKEWLGGLVYEGRVDIKEDIEKSSSMFGFRYCDYEEAAKKCHDLGIDFHLYGVRDKENHMKIYKDTAFVHKKRFMNELIKDLTRHDWGLVGNVYSTPQWNVTLPNKLFDYMAASVPTVAINAKESGDFIEEHNIGIVVQSIEELRDRWKEHRKCREQLLKKRQQFTMENNLGGLERLYADIAN